MTTNGMIPGQDPYTDAEREQLQSLVSDAAAGDPGERNEPADRLEYLRGEIRAERISQGELIELADLAPFIEPGDVELLEWAGVPEFPDDTTDQEPFNRAIAYAKELGAEHGRNAASWYFDGNTADATYERVLRGMEDGDPEILDTLPFADLSGQWADSLTGLQLVDDALDAAGISLETESGDMPIEYIDWFTDICDAYELAFGDAVNDAVETAARAHIGPPA